VALGQIFSENFGFPCQSTFHLLSTIIFVTFWGTLAIGSGFFVIILNDK
jgi:hypothetical protein